MSSHRIGIVLQARVGSKRLPGKVLMPLAGKPMIQWIIERLKNCKKSNLLILATTSLKQDDPLVALSKKLGVTMFRGSSEDVLDRYYQCAKASRLDDIIRATGDNPFVDPEECDRLVDFYFDRGLDYACLSTNQKDGYPVGIGTEIFCFPVLEKSWQEGHAPHHREHVSEYILENRSLFKQKKMPALPEKCAPELSLTVDTEDQFQIAQSIYKTYLCEHPLEQIPVSSAIQMLQAQKNESRGVKFS